MIVLSKRLRIKNNLNNFCIILLIKEIKKIFSEVLRLELIIKNQNITQVIIYKILKTQGVSQFYNLEVNYVNNNYKVVVMLSMILPINQF